MSNFDLTLNTQVIRTVRNGSTVSGVEVENSDGSRTAINVNTGDKVILTAGTMSTPGILYNSGNGPTDQIEIVQNGYTSVNLPVHSELIDLPVRDNLRDHPIFTLTFNTTSQADEMVAADFK
jgi:cellobiose dehydrogenase (acceptor)